MNTTGARTLLSKEVRRFMRVPGQTLLSPLISTTLYFVVFGYTLSGRQHLIQGVPYISFIVPGLVFLGLANNAFLNSSSSLFQSKLMGTVVDLLTAPLGPMELILGFVGGAMVRGVLVGVLTWLVAAVFVGFSLHSAAITFFFVLEISFVFSLLGMIAAIWSEKFEQVNFFPTFVMLPLTFLGGVFYSVQDLPEPWHSVSLFNPMVYMVEGLRFGMLGTSTMSPVLGGGLLLLLSVATAGVVWVMLVSGYKLRQ